MLISFPLGHWILLLEFSQITTRLETASKVYQKVINGQIMYNEVKVPIARKYNIYQFIAGNNLYYETESSESGKFTEALYINCFMVRGYRDFSFSMYLGLLYYKRQ